MTFNWSTRRLRTLYVAGDSKGDTHAMTHMHLAVYTVGAHACTTMLCKHTKQHDEGVALAPHHMNVTSAHTAKDVGVCLIGHSFPFIHIFVYACVHASAPSLPTGIQARDVCVQARQPGGAHGAAAPHPSQGV